MDKKSMNFSTIVIIFLLIFFARFGNLGFLPTVIAGVVMVGCSEFVKSYFKNKDVNKVLVGVIAVIAAIISFLLYLAILDVVLR